MLHNEASEFRAISWSEGATLLRRYQLSQTVTYKIENGRHYKADVYSIDNTSKTIDKVGFIHRYTIKLKNKDGVVFSWYEVVNPTNITLINANEQLVDI